MHVRLPPRSGVWLGRQPIRGGWKAQHLVLGGCTIMLLYLLSWPGFFQVSPVHGNKQCRAAIVLFGLPKSFSVVWKAYQQNLIDNNPHIEFDVSMHLYGDVKVLTNMKNSEIGVPMESRETLIKAIGISDEFLMQSSQEEFDESLTWIQNKHAKKFDPCCWSAETIRNMFRQGNSLKLAYKHALKRGADYSLFVFARSDTFLGRKVDLKCGMPENQLTLPSWHAKRYDVYNDRFAVSGTKAASVYAQGKAEAFFDYVKEDLDTWNSEHMLWRWLNEKKVDVRKGGNGWAPLLRIRGGDRVHRRDALSFPLSYCAFKLRLWTWYT